MTTAVLLAPENREEARTQRSSMLPTVKKDGVQLPHISVWHCNPVNLNLSGSILLEKHTKRPESPVRPLQALLSLRAGQLLRSTWVRLPRSRRSQRQELLSRRLRVRQLRVRRAWSRRLRVRLPRSRRSQRRELLSRRLRVRRAWSRRLRVRRLRSRRSQRRGLRVRRPWSRQWCCRSHPYPNQSSPAAFSARAHVRTSPRCLPRPSCSA